MTVHLVGAGPGDPELISVRGARLVESAEVILHDRLAEPLLALAGDNAKIVDVGKAPGVAPVPQEAINQLLVDYGRSHNHVVRLKGGDPYVFARGAEEVEAAARRGSTTPSRPASPRRWPRPRRRHPAHLPGRHPHLHDPERPRGT